MTTLARGRAAVFACFTLGYFVSFFFRAANAVIARDLAQAFALDAGQLGLMTSLFFVAFAAMQLPIGAALDRLGPRAVTPAVMLIAVAGSLLFAGAGSFAQLAAGRALIGAGMACGLMGLLKAFGAWFPPGRVATLSGVAVGVGALGGLAASTPLALLSAAIGWRAVFTWAAAATALAAAAILLLTRDAPAAAQPPSAAQPAGGFGAIFRDRSFWRIAPVYFFMVGTVQAFQTLWGGPYLTDAAGMSRLDAGAPLLVLSLGVAAGYISSGWLADRLGVGRVVAASLAIFLLGLAAVSAPGLVPPPALLYPSYAMIGYAGAFNLLLLAQARALFPPAMSGRATTALNMFGFVGTTAIQAGMGFLIGRSPADSAGRYPPAAYGAAFLAALACLAAAALWYAPLLRSAERRT